MKRIVKVIAMVFPLVLIASNSHAAVKPGAACKKVGQTSSDSGKKYICVKKGKNFVWKLDNHKPAIEFKAPASPTTSPSPDRKKLTTAERWDATGSGAVSVFTKWGTSKLGAKPNLKSEFFFTSKFWPEVEAEFRNRFNSTAAYYEQFTKIEFPVYFMAGTYDDVEALCTVLESKDATRTFKNCLEDQRNQLSTNYMVARGYDLKNGSGHFYLIKMPEVFDGRRFFSRLEHEFFHTVQQSIMAEKFRTNSPCWFLEGGSEFFGVLVSSYGDIDKYLQLRRETILSAPEKRAQNVTEEELKDWLTAASISSVPRIGIQFDQCAPYRNNGMYHDSILAAEWLVGKIGVDGVIALIKDTAETSWEVAIEKRLGNKYEEVNRLMAQYMYMERQIAISNTWIQPTYCQNRTEPQANKSPAGCWFL